MSIHVDDWYRAYDRLNQIANELAGLAEQNPRLAELADALRRDVGKLLGIVVRDIQADQMEGETEQ